MKSFSGGAVVSVHLLMLVAGLIPGMAQKGAAPDILMFASNAPVCEGTNLAFSALALGDSPMTYKWYKNGVEIVSGPSTLSFNPCSLSDSGVYKVIAVNPYGTDSSFNLTVQIKPLPVVRLGNDTTICVDASITLDAGANFDSYSWSNGTWGQTVNVNNSSTGIYTYIVSVMLNGCYGGDTINITETACTGSAENQTDVPLVWCTGSRCMKISGVSKQFEVEIFDLTGKCVTTFVSGGGSTVFLSMPHLKPGYYMVQWLSKDAEKIFMVYFY